MAGLCAAGGLTVGGFMNVLVAQLYQFLSHSKPPVQKFTKKNNLSPWSERQFFRFSSRFPILLPWFIYCNIQYPNLPKIQFTLLLRAWTHQEWHSNRNFLPSCARRFTSQLERPERSCESRSVRVPRLKKKLGLGGFVFMKSMDWVMNAALCRGFLHGDLNESQCIRFLDRSTIFAPQKHEQKIEVSARKKNPGFTWPPYAKPYVTMSAWVDPVLVFCIFEGWTICGLKSFWRIRFFEKQHNPKQAPHLLRLCPDVIHQQRYPKLARRYPQLTSVEFNR